jgi:APA family basic amino acid/polyamine antiporter
MLTAPRVYFAMAEDGLFFKSVAWLSPRTRVPVLAIALQGAVAVVIAVSGKYEQILNYVVSVDFIWFGLTAASLFVFRRRATDARNNADDERAAVEVGASVRSMGAAHDSRIAESSGGFRVPGHPVTTALFVVACALIVVGTISKYPLNSAIGFAIVVAGIPVYFLWRGRGRR